MRKIGNRRRMWRELETSKSKNRGSNKCLLYTRKERKDEEESGERLITVQ
jgi:hypothetical protein